jgi:hypothetical protein
MPTNIAAPVLPPNVPPALNQALPFPQPQPKAPTTPATAATDAAPWATIPNPLVQHPPSPTPSQLARPTNQAKPIDKPSSNDPSLAQALQAYAGLDWGEASAEEATPTS